MNLDQLAPDDFEALVFDIATRARTTKQLMEEYQCTKEDLKAFVATNRMAIELAKQEREPSTMEWTGSDDVTPTQLSDLWITNKFDRLKRLQVVADLAYKAIEAGSYGDSTLLREFRSYLTLAANELGQLLHRGAGDAADGEMVTYEFKGIDLDNLR